MLGSKKMMEQTMRWFGPKDSVTLLDIKQAGATGIVTALHEYPNGEVWDTTAIRARKKLIAAQGLEWKVVESVPVHEAIKTHSGNYRTYIENYKTTLVNLANEGIFTVCYNFMPLLDWTRTDLNFALPNGAKALRFEPLALAAFDCFILDRVSAKESYSAATIMKAKTYFENLDFAAKKTLTDTILAGLPGAEEGYGINEFKEVLKTYATIDARQLAQHLRLFLSDILPTAEAAGVQLAIHPDDPPFSIFGLPRVVSTYQDIARILKENPSSNNGITFCTGSLGVLPTNDLLKIANDFGNNIHFAHLRSTKRDMKGNFHEANHLDGDVPMYQVVKSLLRTQKRTGKIIPMRPDHGHQLLDDLSKKTNPGYTAIGRLKGLAEIRGLMHGILHEQ